MARYVATRWSSPWEWTINTVPDDTPLGQVGDENPAYVFETFGEAKKWLISQTKAWVDGFQDDAREIRALRARDVEPATTAELTIDESHRRAARSRAAIKAEDGR